MAGLSEAIGSWKMSWSFDRGRRLMAGLTGSPSWRIRPSVAPTRPRTRRPTVVLPLPLSPSRPLAAPDLEVDAVHGAHQGLPTQDSIKKGSADGEKLP